MMGKPKILKLRLWILLILLGYIAFILLISWIAFNHFESLEAFNEWWLATRFNWLIWRIMLYSTIGWKLWKIRCIAEFQPKHRAAFIRMVTLFITILILGELSLLKIQG